MNPSYFRLQIPKAHAVERLRDWMATPENVRADDIVSIELVPLVGCLTGSNSHRESSR